MNTIIGRRSLLALAGAGLTLPIAASCSGAAGGGAGGSNTVRLATNPLQPFYYTAQELGFYAEEDLEVKIVELNSGVTQSLLSGQVDIAAANAGFITQGAQIDRLAWYQMTDRYIFAPIVTADSPITKAEDLSGKTIGMNEANDKDNVDFLLTANGVTLGDYDLVPIGEAAPAAKELVAGKVDAIVIPGTTSFLRAKAAVPDTELRAIPTPASESFYNFGLMASKAYIEKNRDTAVRLGRAVVKGWIWMNENPEATGEMIVKIAPEVAENEEQAIEQTKVNVDWSKNIYQQRGKIDVDILQQEIEVLVGTGMLDATYDANTIVDTTLFDDVWDFDVDEVVQKARADERG